MISISMLSGQDAEKRFSFAKSYVGIDLNYIPDFGTSSYMEDRGNIREFERSSILSPAINFGATHFWGHADFFISIPLRSIKLEEDEVENQLSQRVFTGLRIYPLKLSNNAIRPYLGYKFSAHRYRQMASDNQESQHTWVKSIFDVGLGYQTQSWYAYIGYNRILNPDFDLYLTRDQVTNTSFPSSFVQLGVNMTLEFTNTAQTDKVINAINELGSTNKYGFFVGAGPSSAFTLTNSPRLTEVYPFLDDRVMPGIFPDISIGYHFSKWDIITNLAYRPIELTREALAYEQTLNRRSLVLEAVKGLGDYHGFVPFLGLGVSYENITLTEKEWGAEVYDDSFQKINPVLSFGWDIRPNRSADWLVLRTNLRYSPFLNVGEGSEKMNLNQLEFNFIQVVFYPQRKKHFGI
jgi:hypothetical protein